MARRVCKTLTLAERVEVLKRLENKESQSSVALEFGVNQSQISRIQTNKEKILEDWLSNTNPDRKRKRSGKSGDVEEALLRWFIQARSLQIPVNGPLVIEKAYQLASSLGLTDFKATNGWLARWKARNAIQFKRQHSENDDFVPERWVAEVLPGILKSYSPGDIFCTHKTGLFWRALPYGTMSYQGAGLSVGCNDARDRMTVLLACNVDGSEKLDPLAIGRHKNPRCLSNIRNLPVDYDANKNSFMTPTIWEDWLKRVDTRMQSEQRTIVVLCDNCAARIGTNTLTNVRLVYLPLNLTSLIHPMDQGIIACFKKQYRSLVLRRLVSEFDSGQLGDRAAERMRKITVLDSLHMQREAWNKVTHSTIASCYRSFAGLFSETVNDTNLQENSRENGGESEVYLPCGMTAEDFAHYVALDNGLPTEDKISFSANVVTLQHPPPIKEDESSEEDDDDGGTTAPVSFSAVTQSLHIIRTFLEQSGCQSYERLYNLEEMIHGLHYQTDIKPSVGDV